MAVCPSCQTVNRDTARFCAKCGQVLRPTASPATPYAPPAAGLTGRLPANSMIKNRYLIARKVGQGGMAAVYQAVDTYQPGTVWAVKEMSDAALITPQERTAALQLFYQEANLLCTLDHPNLPKVTDVFAEGGKQYLVMEFVSGRTLEDMLAARSQPFTEAEVLSWAMQLCDVLAYLHSRNIIFRDLKPANIMLTSTGQIKLIDFGIVRFFKPGKTRDTQALGTPGYAAPEAASAQTDARSDIYSLCVVLYQLLTGHDPCQVPNQPLPPAPRLSPALEQILRRGAHLQRDQRWKSVNELRAQFSQSGGRSPSLPVGTQGGGAPVPVKTSRPTTRLIMVAARLSPRQLALGVGGATLAVVVATWLLAPILSQLRIEWNLVPITAVFGALGYATFQKRGMTFGAHVLFTAALTLTINLRLGWLAAYNLPTLLGGIVISGAVMEGWAYYTKSINVAAGDEAWKRELAWMASMEVIGTVIFFGIVFNGHYLLNPIQWVLAAAFGALGWFLGDLFHQYLLYRKMGFGRRP